MRGAVARGTSSGANRMKIIARFAGSQSGATAVEYALICMCIVLAIVVSLTSVGTNLNNVYAELPGIFK